MARSSNRKPVIVPLPPASTMPSLFDIQEPACPPAKNFLLESWNGMLSRRRLRRAYHTVQMHIERLPGNADRLGAGIIFCATHAEPDDCAMAHYIMRKHFCLDPYFLLEVDQIRDQPTLARMGAIGIRYESAADTAKSLHFAAELLRGTDLPGTLPYSHTRPRGLWLQPVDDTRSMRAGVLRCRTTVARLVRFTSGLKDDTGANTSYPPASTGHPRMSARLRRAQMVPLVIPVALHRRPCAADPNLPDLYIDFAEPWELNDFNIKVQAWTHLLEERMNAHLIESTRHLREAQDEGYVRILK